MNKFLLFSISVLFSLAIAAQESVNIQNQVSAPAQIDGIPLIQQHNELEAQNNSASRQGDAETIFLGTSGNIYTILLAGNNQVSYNPDIDAVTFIHRKEDAAPLNGVMEFDYSTDGGASWSVNQGPLSPNFADGTETGIGNGLRYPNGVLWAPEGSTSSDDAYIFGNGPTLDTETASWGNLFEVSSKLDGTNVTESYTNYTDTLNGQNIDFHPYATTQVGDDIWSLSTQFNNTGDTNFDTLSYDKFYLTKSSFNDVTNSFDTETVQTFEPNWIVNDDGDGTFSNFFQTYTMAWDPSGMIGYVVLVGAQESTFGYEPIPKPNVWKTVDAGATWYELQEFDFQTLDEMQNNLVDAIGGEVVRPYFTTTDAAVDSNGELHLFSHLLSGFTNHPDSAGFIYTDPTSQFFYHCYTTSETEWNANVVTEVINSDDAADFSLGDQPLRFKPQISRTPDGSKMFFSYHKSLETLDLTQADIFARAYDVDTEIYAHEENLTEDTDFEQFTFYHTLAPICKVNGECRDYELPIVFIEPGSDDLSSCQHIYLYGAGFDDINFDPASVADIEEDLTLDVYPNPSNGAFLLSLPNNESGTIQIVDISGKLVFEAQNQFGQTTIDLTDQKAGSYIVNYVTAKEVRTSHIIIQ